jgi:hypothetical protein
VSALEQLSGKGMPKGVTRHSLADPRCLRRIGHSSLNDGFMQVIPSLLPLMVLPSPRRRKTQRQRQSRAAEGIFRAIVPATTFHPSACQILFVKKPGVDDLLVHRGRHHTG